jgi:hypothetical protein
LAVASATFNEDCFLNEMTSRGVAMQLVEPVGQRTADWPQMMVGVNDAASGVNNFFADLAEPFRGSGRVTIHQNVLVLVLLHLRTGVDFR